MNIGYLPQEHMHRLVDSQKPAYHYEGGDLAAWQKEARAKLSELLGMQEIEKAACPLVCEIEYDRYAEDLDCREIRIRYTAEENVTVPCHICIPIMEDAIEELIPEEALLLAIPPRPVLAVTPTCIK